MANGGLSQEPPATSRSLAWLRGPIPHPTTFCRPDPPSDRRYRKVVANLCQGGVDPAQNPAPLPCPLTPPRGLRVSIVGDAVAVRPGDDVLLEVRQEQVSRGRRPRAPPGGPAWASPEAPRRPGQQERPSGRTGEQRGVRAADTRVRRLCGRARLPPCSGPAGRPASITLI